MRPTTPCLLAAAAFSLSAAPLAYSQGDDPLDPVLSDLMAIEDDSEDGEDDDLWADLAADDEDIVQVSGLAELSLEDLMGLDVEVTSVSRKAEKLQNTAAAVHVISSEDIRRSGVRTIPDALRMAPGIRVTRLSSGRYAVTARGFTWEYADKVLVLVDGRSVYSPLFSGTEWEVLDLPVEEVERIEVIRGPGGTMWGSNAVNGVINIITKSAEGDQDESLTVVYGDEERHDVILRGGTQLGQNGFLRGFARFNERSPLESNSTGIEDSFEQGRVGLRGEFNLGDKSDLMVSVSAFDIENHRGQALPVSTPPFRVPVDNDQDATGGSFLARWTKEHRSGAVSTVQGSIGYLDSDSSYVVQDRQQIDIFYQRESELTENQTFVWGVSFRHSDVEFGNNDYFTWDKNRHDQYYAGFLQDQIRVNDRTTVTVGVKLEDNPFTGLEVQPNLRVAYQASERTTWWGAISRAIQTPSEAYRGARVLFDYIPDQGSGFNTSVVLHEAEGDTPESVIAFEGGMRTKIGSKGSLDISAFVNEYRDTPSASFGTPFPTGPGELEMPLIYDGNAAFTTMGVEVASSYAFSPNLVARGSYSFIHVDGRYDEPSPLQWGFEGSTPKHLAHLGLSYDVSQDWELDTNAFFVSKQRNNGFEVDPSIRADVRVGWRPYDGVTATFALQGLFHDDEAEINPDTVTDPYGAQTGAYLGLRFQL